MSTCGVFFYLIKYVRSYKEIEIKYVKKNFSLILKVKNVKIVSETVIYSYCMLVKFVYSNKYKLTYHLIYTACFKVFMGLIAFCLDLAINQCEMVKFSS